jgi:hypothetical protein
MRERHIELLFRGGGDLLRFSVGDDDDA